MQDSQVVSVLRQFRGRMDGMDEQLMRDLAQAWTRVERALDAELQALAEEMARRAAEGETITEQLIRRSERFRQLQAQAAQEAQRFSNEASEIIGAYQERAAIAGIDSAKVALINSYPSAAVAMFDRIYVEAVEAIIGFAGDGSPLWVLLAKAYGEDIVEGLIQSLITGIATGESVKSIVAGMVDTFGMGLDRALLVARTETQRAYRMGAVEQYRQSGVVSGFMRLVKKDGACLACLLLDGEVFETADELDDHPNGRCTAVPIVRGTKPPEWEKGKDWLMRQDEAKQREIMGDKRYELWQSGTPLEAMVEKHHDATWGDNPQVKPLSELE